MKPQSTPKTLKLLLLVLMLTVTGCASTAIPSVPNLPQPSKPQVPSELMQKEKPQPLSFLQRLQGAFWIPVNSPTGK